MHNVVCLKWGSLYGPEYVNNLYAMVKRNLTQPFRFICFTENTAGLNSKIETKPLPAHLKGWWGKCYFFAQHDDIEGPVLSIDLDMVIVDNIDCFFEYEPTKFCMKWDYVGLGNSSCVMRFEANRYTHIYNNLKLNDKDFSMDNLKPNFKTRRYWGDQVWITEQMAGREIVLWPKTWVPKFAIDCHMDSETKIPFSQIARRNRKGLPKFFVPDDAKILAFAGIHQRNEKELHKIGKWWHANDI